MCQLLISSIVYMSTKRGCIVLFRKSHVDIIQVVTTLINTSICNQTNHLGSPVNLSSCGNTEHTVMVKVTFAISYFKKGSLWMF